jgi:BirA family biotin operon repressor/biotin-[acetyl-CoA-carboxylase] ligase
LWLAYAILKAKPQKTQSSGAEARTDQTLGRIVRLLSDNATLVVSGTKIADEIGTTRLAVWRMIEQLRQSGVAVTGHAATGYRLERIPDLLLPEFLAPKLTGTIFTHVHHYFRTGSTNAVAMQAAAEGEAEGTVFLAEQQTAGRGRGGHSWESPPSTGIYVSLILRPRIAPAEVLPLSLTVGLSVREAIQEVTGLDCDLRWPNDVLLNGKKICGILAEMSAEATRVRHVVVGIGLNVNHREFLPELAKQATSLQIETGTEYSRVDLLITLLKILDRRYAQLQASGGAAQVLRDFERDSSFARGRRVHVEEDGGYDGTTAGLDQQGFLLVRTAEGVKRVLSGGVRPL